MKLERFLEITRKRLRRSFSSNKEAAKHLGLKESNLSAQLAQNASLSKKLCDYMGYEKVKVSPVFELRKKELDNVD